MATTRNPVSNKQNYVLVGLLAKAAGTRRPKDAEEASALMRLLVHGNTDKPSSDDFKEVAYGEAEVKVIPTPTQLGNAAAKLRKSRDAEAKKSAAKPKAKSAAKPKVTSRKAGGAKKTTTTRRRRSTKSSK